MRKLGKKIANDDITIEAYCSCSCYCEACVCGSCDCGCWYDILYIGGNTPTEDASSSANDSIYSISSGPNDNVTNSGNFSFK